MPFTLHPTLKKDCIELTRLELCRVLLMNDSQFPWLILVPEREDMTEIHQLSSHDQQQLMTESSYIAQQMQHLFKADKMNTAALGNVVSQLHIHHIARYKTDKAWPAPIWGKFNAIAYTADTLSAVQDKLKPIIQQH
ncbi:MAG: HIT domain-containing protein [Methylococcales bacterium]|nr:HIT domain-containing protein [Methylococcales bacterium]